MKTLVDNLLVWFVASASLAVACASNPKSVETKVESSRPETTTSVEQVPEVTKVDACAPERLSGRWLIQTGTARMKCDDGRETSITAGGTVELGKNGDRLKMLDGSCEYVFSRNACEFNAPPGGVCKQDAATYEVREVSLKAQSSGVLRMVYSLARKDGKGGVCTDSTDADLVAVASQGCAPVGQWSSEITASGKSGHVEFRVDAGRCSIRSPEFSGEGPCKVEGEHLVFQADAQSWSGSCGANEGRYAFSIAAGCAGLVLESTQDGCAGRVGAIDYLFLRRVR